MNQSTPSRTRTHQRPPTSNREQLARRLGQGAQRPSSVSENLRPPVTVVPVAFVEPGTTRETRSAAEHHPRPDRSSETMGRLRVPFTPDAPG